jgi:hypothetical protein
MMSMVSGWWLLAAFWLGGCLSIVLVALLYMARSGDDLEEEVLAGARQLPFGGEQATPEA